MHAISSSHFDSRRLPLETLDTALNHLVPKVEQYSASVANKPNADERVLSFLREQSLQGILPQAPPICEVKSIHDSHPIDSDSLLCSLQGHDHFNGIHRRLFGCKVSFGESSTSAPCYPCEWAQASALAIQSLNLSHGLSAAFGRGQMPAYSASRSRNPHEGAGLRILRRRCSMQDRW